MVTDRTPSAPSNALSNSDAWGTARREGRGRPRGSVNEPLDHDWGRGGWASGGLAERVECMRVVPIAGGGGRGLRRPSDGRCGTSN
jgi:hypothetical protein